MYKEHTQKKMVSSSYNNIHTYMYLSVLHRWLKWHQRYCAFQLGKQHTGLTAPKKASAVSSASSEMTGEVFSGVFKWKRTWKTAATRRICPYDFDSIPANKITLIKKQQDHLKSRGIWHMPSSIPKCMKALYFCLPQLLSHPCNYKLNKIVCMLCIYICNHI